MSRVDNYKGDYDFFADPRIIENYNYLEELGVLDYVMSLEQENHDRESLLNGALDIFNRTTINEIIDATVLQISHRFSPALTVFLWKPIMNRDDVIIKCYKDDELVDIEIKLNSINTLEPFFQIYPRPIGYDVFSYELNDNETINALSVVNPEIVIPIMGPSGLYGLMLMGQKHEGDKYNKGELVFLQHLMSFVSKAVQNNLHYERTLRDIKTGLYNNGFFMTRLSEEISRSSRSQAKSSVIIMDVDKFKNFNDTYGHIAGDRVLETLAVTIKQGIRLADVASRFGGEEFTVLLPETDSDTAWIVAERLRKMVEQMDIPWDPPLPPVTISLGIFTFDRDTGLPAEDIVGRADTAMYHSKQIGRNCTSIWDPSYPQKNQ